MPDNDEESMKNSAEAAGARAHEPPSGSGRDRRGELRENFRTFLFLTILLLVFLATMQLYFSVQGFISAWFATEYVPVITAGFYLFVIVCGLYIVRACLIRQNS
jgi:uncharacterized membrane protein (DUF485 family)